METKPKQIWFPAKKYGWGWDLPCAWQGWVVLIVWIAAIVASGILFVLGNDLTLFIVSTVLLASALLIICLIKGEKPRWR